MREQSDLSEIKERLKIFLYLEIKENPSKPELYVRHPVFLYRYFQYPNSEEKIDLLNDIEKIEQILKEYSKKIDNLKSVDDCMKFLRNPYYLVFIKHIKDLLSLDDFSRILGDAWVYEEFSNEDEDIPLKLAVKWFKEAKKDILMNKNEYEIYCNLPESFVIYRGVTTRNCNPDGISWTRDIGQAELDSQKFGDGYIRIGLANKKDALAYFNRRGYEEIVIETKKIEQKEIVKYK